MISILLGNKERELRFQFNDVCDIETKSGMSITDLLGEHAGFNMIRLLFWGGLKHENRGLTLEIVGLWIHKSMVEDNSTLDGLAEIAIKALVESGVLGNAKSQEMEVNMEKMAEIK